MTDIWWDGIPNWIGAVGTAVASGFAVWAFFRTRVNAANTEVLREAVNAATPAVAPDLSVSGDAHSHSDSFGDVGVTRAPIAWQITRSKSHSYVLRNLSNRPVHVVRVSEIDLNSRTPLATTEPLPALLAPNRPMIFTSPRDRPVGLGRFVVTWIDSGEIGETSLVV